MQDTSSGTRDRYAAPPVTQKMMDPRIVLYGLTDDDRTESMIEAIEKLVIPKAEEVIQDYGYQSPPPLANKLASVALFLSVFSLVVPVLWPFALVLAIFGLAKAFLMRRVGMNQVVAALVLLALGALVWGVTYYLAYSIISL